MNWSIRRTMIGLVALVLLCVGGVMWFVPDTSAAHQQWTAACLRVGLAMAALWLALPDVQRVPAWITGAVLVLVVVLALRPRLFLLALAVVVVLAIVRPRVRSA